MSVGLHADLAFDVGMHTGEDTDYYLRKGFRVVAFEANPKLIAQAKTRFADAIGSGRLTIVDGAIANTTAASITFYEHPTKSVWGTINEDWAQRNTWRGQSHKVTVPVVNFARVIEKHGMPLSLKIDIEGADALCLEALKEFDVRPSYISIESEKVDFKRLVREFKAFEMLGYDRFAVRQQEGINWRERLIRTLDGETVPFRFTEGASGPCCDDVDEWMTAEEAIDRYRSIFLTYSLFGDRSPLGRNKLSWMLLKVIGRTLKRPIPGWFDTHATRSNVLDARRPRI